MTRIALAGLAALLAAPAAHSADLYNTVKTKLREGKKVVGGTITTSDPKVYCSMANAGFDFLWIEMQHSPLDYSDVAKITLCPEPGT